MKTIGLIGGMSCKSTALYYERLNAGARERLGGLHSAEMVLWSVDFARIERMQARSDWNSAGRELAHIAKKLESAGADLIVLATNTMHRVADAIEAGVRVPFIHIADATGEAIRRGELKRPGLIATAYTMSEPFYADRLRERFGLDVIVPAGADFDDTHAIIYDELCKGVITENSRRRYVEIADGLVKRGADSIILGCTEVSMLLKADDVEVPVFDTAGIHVDAALDAALAKSTIGDAA